jgi:hypothetical protein
LELADKERRALLREKWQEEKKYALKMSLREHLLEHMNSSINNNANTNQIIGTINENSYLENNGKNQDLTL